MKLAKLDVKSMQRQAKHFMRSNSPEIKLGIGLLGVAVSTILFCRGTLKAEKVKEVFDHDSSMIRNAENVLTDMGSRPKEEQAPLSISFHEGQAVHPYDMSECRREMGMTYRKAVVGFFKCYALPTVIMVGSVLLIISSHGELRALYSASNAALATALASYDQLRTNIRNEYGADAENKLVNGITAQEITHTEVDEDGKEVSKTETESHWNGKLGKYSMLISKYPGAEWKYNPWTADEMCFNLTAKGLLKELNRHAKDDEMVCLNDIFENFGHEKREDAYSIIFHRREDGEDPIRYSIHTVTDDTVGPTDVGPQHRKAYIIDIHVDESNAVQY